jgi:hypothetical protein
VRPCVVYRAIEGRARVARSRIRTCAAVAFACDASRATRHPSTDNQVEDGRGRGVATINMEGINAWGRSMESSRRRQAALGTQQINHSFVVLPTRPAAPHVVSRIIHNVRGMVDASLFMPVRFLSSALACPDTLIQQPYKLSLMRI